MVENASRFLRMLSNTRLRTQIQVNRKCRELRRFRMKSQKSLEESFTLCIVLLELCNKSSHIFQ